MQVSKPSQELCNLTIPPMSVSFFKAEWGSKLLWATALRRERNIVISPTATNLSGQCGIVRQTFLNKEIVMASFGLLKAVDESVKGFMKIDTKNCDI